MLSEENIMRPEVGGENSQYGKVDSLAIIKRLEKHNLRLHFLM